MKIENKKFLKENFNIDADKYSDIALKEILSMINKKILINTKYLIEENKVLESRIDYYKSYLENN